MGRTLTYADSANAYILVDKGTWLAKRKQLRLVKLFAGDRLLANPYHIIGVKPADFVFINTEGAQRFIRWMTSKPGQDIIRDFTVDNEHLFIASGDS